MLYYKSNQMKHTALAKMPTIKDNISNNQKRKKRYLVIPNTGVQQSACLWRLFQDWLVGWSLTAL